MASDSGSRASAISDATIPTAKQTATRPSDASAHPGAQLADDVDDGDWILVGDEVPLDDAARDELLERLEVSAVRAGEPDAEADEDIVEEELRALTAPAADPELAAEVRQLVEARNARRVARGQPPLDVEAEVSKRLRNE